MVVEKDAGLTSRQPGVVKEKGLLHGGRKKVIQMERTIVGSDSKTTEG